MSEVFNYALYFFIYSFLGWVCETIYCSVLQKQYVNRGFLNGPVCPVYGVGAIIVIMGLWSYRDSMIAVFIVGMILTSVVEYITAVILEKSFHAKWWDYSHYKYNIHGRVCLLNSFMFGVLSVVIIEYLHPFIIKYLNFMNENVLKFMLFLCTATIILDFVITVKALNALTGKVDIIENVLEDMRKLHSKIKIYEKEAKLKLYEEEEEFMRKFKKNPEELLQKIRSIKLEHIDIDLDIDDRLEDLVDDIHSRVKKLKERSYIHRRVLKAFPNIKSVRREHNFQYIKSLLNDKKGKK